MEKILVIEDEAIIRENIAEILRISGYESLQADNGFVGVQQILEHKPDLVICDVMMPRLNGYQVLETIRKSSETATIPFIFLTAKASPEDIRKGMSLGADDYLTKPFSRDELIGAIESRLEKQRMHKQDINQKIEAFKSQIGDVYSHELNTPLNGILGMSELLLYYFDEFDKSELKKMIRTIHNSGKRLQHITDNMLFYFQSLQKPGFLKSAPREETECIHYENYLMKLAKQYNRDKDIHLDIDCESLPLSKKLLDKIIYELTDNAFKFSENGSPVQISITEYTHNYTLSVKDEGYGIREDQISKIKSFEQHDRSEREQQGLGLGLYLCQQIFIENNIGFNILSRLNQGTEIIVSWKKDEKSQ